jgi:low affinity Fe/Cu permease
MFDRLTRVATAWTGSPGAVIGSIAIVIAWALTGPIFGFSDTWQLVINTATTIITFLMVFVIQNTQNRDTASMHIKIDELIRVTQKARNTLLDLEELDDRELETLHRDFQKLAKTRPHLQLKRAESDETPPERPRKR